MYNNKTYKGMHYGYLECVLTKFHDFSRLIFFSNSMTFPGFLDFFQIPWLFQVRKKFLSFSRFTWFFQRLETLFKATESIIDLIPSKPAMVIIWFRIWEKGTNVLGKWSPPDECHHSSHEKLYIFGHRRISPFRNYIAFHGYFEGIHMAVTWISFILPRFSSTLVPFSQIRNHLMSSVIKAPQYCSKWLFCYVHCIIQPQLCGTPVYPKTPP